MALPAPVEVSPPHEVRDLWLQFTRSREPTLRETLIKRYLPLARRVALRLFRMRSDDSIAFDDYLQYARVGLVESIDRYDPQRAASFETYSSYRIRGAILNGLGTETEVTAQRTFWRTSARERVESMLPGQPEQAHDRLEDFVQLTMGLALGFLLESDSVEAAVDESVPANPYAATELAELRRRAHDLVETLPERERDIVERHYFGECEFQTIARELGVTKGRVSQLHAQALTRMRQQMKEPPGLDRKI